MRKKDFYGKLENSEQSEYTKSLKKASFLFQFYKKSKWVDDALLIVGKIYYIRSDHFRAITKFDELIDNYPNSQLVNQAKVWKARTLIAVKDYTESERILTELIKNEKKDMKIISESYYELGNLYYERELYSIANANYSKSIKDPPDHIKYYSYYRTAESYMKLKQFADAVKYYDMTLKESKDKFDEYNLRQKKAFALIEKGDFIEAMKIISNDIEQLNQLRREKENKENFKYKEQLEKATYNKAYCYEKRKDYNLALSIYEYLTTEFKLDSITVNGHYRLGEYFLNHSFNLTAAEFHYQKVLEQKKNELIEKAEEKTEIITRLKELTSKLSQLDLHVDSSETENFFPSRTKQRRHLKAEDLILRSKILDSTFHIVYPDKKNTKSIDEIKTRIADFKSGKINYWKLELAEIYLLELTQPKKALELYKEVLNNPTIDKELKAVTTFYLAWCYENYFFNNQKAQELYKKLFNEFYQTSFVLQILDLKQDQLDIEEKESVRFYEIIDEYISNHKIDSAAAYTEFWLEHYTDSVRQPLTLYQMGKIHRKLIYWNEKANKYFQRLTESFPNHEITLKYKRSSTKKSKKKTDSTGTATQSDSTGKKLIDSTLNQVDSSSIKPDSLPTPREIRPEEAQQGSNENRDSTVFLPPQNKKNDLDSLQKIDVKNTTNQDSTKKNRDKEPEIPINKPPDEKKKEDDKTKKQVL